MCRPGVSAGIATPALSSPGCGDGKEEQKSQRCAAWRAAHCFANFIALWAKRIGGSFIGDNGFRPCGRSEDEVTITNGLEDDDGLLCLLQRHLQLHATQCVGHEPVHRDVMLVLDESRNAFGLQTTTQDMCLRRHFGAGYGHQHQ